MELQDIQSVMKQISTEKNIDTMSIQEKSALVAALLKKVASERGIELKLRKTRVKIGKTLGRLCSFALLLSVKTKSNMLNRQVIYCHFAK